MEETFNKLKKEGRNSVDNLIAWMKDSKIVDDVKVSEERARKLFDDVRDKQHVEMEKFQQALSALAAEQKASVEVYSRTLATEGKKFLSAVAEASTAAGNAAADAFKRAMDRK
ncbi:uncharacterized protein LOC112049652 [Bicyclus anynana]|uniref:Uncharacterized protein LOC112049652 n=1 Tax=Bicyclus anynana TaxID=110368 RepID=A0ABM3LI84_BICAN|nr:uncharacterized protein LOC112049652 [Bicyclus anynana]